MLCATIVGLASLSLYLYTLAPGLTWAHDSGDGGELATAAWTLGVAHPPGYPTYLLLAHLFTRLPIGEVATRTNLFSACCAAVACALVTWTLMQRTGCWTAGVGAGLALAVSPLFWGQATVTEVHALNGLFTALVLTLVSPVRPGAPSARGRPAVWAVALGLIWGLSLGNHPTALLVAPVVLLALYRVGRPGWLGVVGVLTGLAVYVYLPLRAAAAPPVNWGNPQTLRRFWWMISGALYRPFLFSLPLAFLPARLLAWAGVISRQFGWLGVITSALGSALLWKQDRAFWAATAATIALCSVLAIGYDTTDSYLYLVPAVVCLTAWLGMGIYWLLGVVIESTVRTPWRVVVVSALIVALPIGAAIQNLPAHSLREDRSAYAFEAQVLGHAPFEAIILCQEDTHTFTLWYMQYALGRRPDVTVVDLGLLQQDWYAVHLGRQLEHVRDMVQDRDRDLQWVAARQTASARLNRPVCIISPQEFKLTCVRSREG